MRLHPLQPSMLLNRLGYAVLTLVGLFFSVSCGAPGPYYADFLFSPPKLVETDRSRMVIYLDWYIRTGRVQRIEVLTPESGLKVIHPRESDSPDIDWLPLPVLYAARFILNPRYRGLEVDLLARTETEGYVPISARHDVDGSIHLLMGKPLAALLPAPSQQLSAAQLQQLFVVGAIRDDDRAWRPYELFALERALSLLSAEERVVTKDLQFIRRSAASGDRPGVKHSEIWGQYHGGSGKRPAEVLLFDTEPEHDEALFIGEPDHPQPLPAMCLLHEIGHAIADYPRMTLERECAQQQAEYQRLTTELNAHSTNAQAPAAELQVLEQRLADLGRARDEHDRRHAELAALYQKSPHGPVVSAFLAARGPKRGPTKYGGRAPKESFAESFALYRADPAALQRIYPAVYDWFAGGGHLRAMPDPDRAGAAGGLAGSRQAATAPGT